MNNVQLYGRLVRDPEVRMTSEALAVTRFTLAVDRQVKKGGQKETDFINCVAFGKIGENIGNYLKKGSGCIVLGNIRTGSYTDKNGKTVYTTNVNVNSFEFTEKRGSNNAPGGDGSFTSMGASEPFTEDIEF